MSATARDQVVVSYLRLRRVVGVLGVALPVVLALWGFVLCRCVQVLPSISDYYGLRTRDALVGVLFTWSWFLFTYRGYGPKDDIAGNLACVFALGVALFPSTGSRVEKVVHFASAAAFFLILAYFALVLFTKSHSVPTPQKRIRNGIYRFCGVVMLSCLVLIALYRLRWKGTALDAWRPVFWLESLALWAFGISWFIKGETLFKDPPR